ncbi:MAG: hypothetical protein KJ025_19785 [Burkholderiales bacterium]|nr:hypothetical protein [Burkholderiales bacterium]
MSAIFPPSESTGLEPLPAAAQHRPPLRARIFGLVERICEACYRSRFVQRHVDDAMRRAARFRTHGGLDADDMLG